MPKDTYEPAKRVADDPTKPPRVTNDSAISDESALSGPHVLDCSVKDFILRRLKSCEEDGEWEERLRVAVMLENCLYYRGQHELYVTQDCRVESSYDPDDEDELIKHNWYAHLVEGKAKEWEAAKPRIEITGRTNDYRLEGAARLAEALDDFTRKSSIKAHFRQSEAKFGMLMKVYYRYAMLVRDESDETATRLQVPITEPQTLNVGAVYGCGGCGAEFGGDISAEARPAKPDSPDETEQPSLDVESLMSQAIENYDPDADGDNHQEPQAASPACPECGETDGHQEMSPGFSSSVDVPVGVREVLVPKLKHVSVNPLAVKVDYKARTVPGSAYLIYDTLERRYEIEAEHPECDAIESASNLPIRLRAMQELERTSAGVNAFILGDRLASIAREDDLIRKRRFWMLPKMYAHKRAQADETLCGVEIKQGQRLGDVFKSGLLAIVVGSSELIAVVDENKNKKWAGSSVTIDPTTFHGKGSEDLNSIQNSIDDKATLAQSHWDRAAAPSEVVNTKLVDVDEFDGITGKRIAMKDTAPEGAKPADVIHVVKPGELGGDFLKAFEMEPDIMREIGGVPNSMVGLEDPHNETAKGRAIAAQQSSSLLIPALALRAEEVETETSYQNLEYWQEYAAEEDFALFESEFGSEAIETFRKLNLRRDLNVEAVPGSWIPKTKDQELQDIEDFAVKYLVPASQQAVPMSFVRHAAGLYDIPSSVFEPERDVKLAQARLAKLRDWADHATQSGASQLSPQGYEIMLEQIINQPEFIPNPLIEMHPVHIEFWSDQFKQMYDDGKINPVLLDLISKMVDAHYQAAAEAEVKKQMFAMKAQAPMIKASAAMADHQATLSDRAQGAQDARDHRNKDIDARRALATQAAQQHLLPAGPTA